MRKYKKKTANAVQWAGIAAGSALQGEQENKFGPQKGETLQGGPRMAAHCRMSGGARPFPALGIAAGSALEKEEGNKFRAKRVKPSRAPPGWRPTAGGNGTHWTAKKPAEASAGFLGKKGFSLRFPGPG